MEAFMSVKPIPEGYHTLTPFLTVRNAARAIEFYKQLGATPLTEWTIFRVAGDAGSTKSNMK